MNRIIVRFLSWVVFMLEGATQWYKSVYHSGPGRSVPPLQFAAGTNDAESVVALLKEGADINVHGMQDWTPLHTAAAMNYLEVVTILVEHGADINAQDYKGRAPLHLVMADADLERIAIALIKAGANVSLKTVNGMTPLDLARADNNRRLEKALVDAGAMPGLLPIRPPEHDG